MRTIDDVARVAPEWRAGFGYEFLERPDGYPGLANAYGLRFRAPPSVMDLSLSYRALASRQVDLIAGDATAGLIKGLDLFRNWTTTATTFRRTRRRLSLAPRCCCGIPRCVRRSKVSAGRISADDMQAMNDAADASTEDVAEIVAALPGGASPVVVR